MNQGTTERQWGFVDSIGGYARQGIRALTVHRSQVGAYGLDKAARLISNGGLKMLGVSRCASLTEDDPARIAANREENRRTIDLAAELDATNLAMISSGLPAGFDGYDELELFSERNCWKRDPDEVIDAAIARHRAIFGDDG